jgi:hypothetical protein
MDPTRSAAATASSKGITVVQGCRISTTNALPCTEECTELDMLIPHSCCVLLYNSLELHKVRRFRHSNGGWTARTYFCSLCFYPVLSFRLTSARTPHQLFNFTFPARQTEKRAPNRGQEGHEHRDARTIRAVTSRVLVGRDGLGETRRRDEKQAERKRGRKWHEGTQRVYKRALVRGD